MVLLLSAVVLASFLAIHTTNASGTPTLGVDSATQQFPSAHAGDTIQVNITISNVQNLWAWDIAQLTWNPQVMNLTNMIEGPFLQTSGQQTLFVTTLNATNAWYLTNQGYLNETSGLILQSTGVTGSGVVATLVFKVFSTGTSQIKFTQATLEDPSTASISCNIANANIIIGSSSNTTPTPPSSDNGSPGTSSSPIATSSTPTNSGTTSRPTEDPSNVAPEFPILPILAMLMIAATASIMLIAKKSKQDNNQQNLSS